MSNASPGEYECKTLNEVFAAELDCLRPQHGLYAGPAVAGQTAPLRPPCSCAKDDDRAADLKRVFKTIAGWSAAQRAANAKGGADTSGTPKPLSALCLSGGGIRSATFNLGVLQSLARAKLLGEFDYLSSVSGGGYIAAWLRAWMHRAGVTTVVNQLGTDPHGFSSLSPEPKPVAQLRDYSNYLTPVVGLFSGDTWSAAATILRNLLLNWIMLLPAMGALIGIPVSFLLYTRTNDMEVHAPMPLLVIALGIEGVASLLVYLVRRFAKDDRLRQQFFILTCVLPICAAAGALSAAALVVHLPGTDRPLELVGWPSVWLFCAIWSIGVPLVGWFLAEMIAQFVTGAKRWAAGLAASQETPSKEDLEENVRSVSFVTELMALTVSGSIGMCLLVGVTYTCYPFLFSHPALYAVFVLPMLLGVYLISRVIFVGLASYSDELGEKRSNTARIPAGAEVLNRIYGNDADREWWSRLSGWLLLVIVAWTVVTGICLFGCYLPDNVAQLTHWIAGKLRHLGVLADTASHATGKGAAESGSWSGTAGEIFKWIVGVVGGVSGLTAALRGSDPATPASCGSPATNKAGSPTRILGVAGVLFLVCVIMVVSWIVKGVAQGIILAIPWERLPHYLAISSHRLQDFPGYVAGEPLELQFSVPAHDQPIPWQFTAIFVGVLVMSALLAFTAGRFVNVNRFSLHGMYRNRLVRAYLGASNCPHADGRERRRPDPFTGFALTDNFPLHCLCDPPPAEHQPTDATPHDAQNTHCTCSGRGEAEQPSPCKPLSIINTTLNLVNGEKLAWQQRKAASFSMTPLFCGNWLEGYRSSKKYGGPDGITVGTAMTISGAAANPNMGYCSSPVLGFLMAMFNLRLGAWLGNTNEHGDESYTHPGPRHALLRLLAEMLGQTNSGSSYVNLSDGGHFDNLGLYEAVLRRCRYILVSDAGRDEDFTFEDLGNSIRKIRIDFGVDIDFKTIRIFPNNSSTQGLCCAIGDIRYSLADGTKTDDDGVLIYIKPTLRAEGQIPYDIYGYSKHSSQFPHESTVDQWFNESQFESYRALGCYLVNQLADRIPKEPPPADSLQAFFAAVSKYASGDSSKQEPVPSAASYAAVIKYALRSMPDPEVVMARQT